MLMKSQVLRMIFDTLGRVDVEPPSVADSLRKLCDDEPPSVAGIAVDDDVVDNIEDEVVEIFSSELPEQPL
jgi:hypothetical protein